jgi:hypothetical protein
MVRMPLNSTNIRKLGKARTDKLRRTVDVLASILASEWSLGLMPINENHWAEYSVC